MAVVQHLYRYLAPSFLAPGQRPRLTLATSAAGQDAHPHFFQGAFKQPRLSAELLTAVHLVVGARYHTPPNMLAKAIALADPIVTSGGGLLRFEGFSSCCSAYIRVDMLEESYEGRITGKGTTNVDFNAPLCAALARVRDDQGLSASVGSDEFVLDCGGDKIVEKRVTLPTRWIRGLVEVQSYQASMRQRIEVGGHEALRFLRSLPRASTRNTPLWIVAGPFGLRTTTTRQENGVRLVDASRLRILEALLPRAQSLTIHADDAQQANAWVLAFPGARLTLVLSAEVWRGFSGEGQALRALLGTGGAEALAEVRANLHWQRALDAGELARQLSFARQAVEDALRILGVSGLVGYDLSEGAYFHRVLPFDLSAVEDMHPRLLGARTLLEQDAVAITRASPLEACVKSGTSEHRVREADGELRCTCPWYSKYQGTRGPCKHILTVESCRSDMKGRHP